MYSFQLRSLEREPVLLFFVTTSPCQEWVFARLLPSLDVVAVSHAPSPESNPDSPLPRYDRGRHITYHRKLIGRTLERYVAGSRPCDQPKVIQSPPIGRPAAERRPIGFDLIKAFFPLARSEPICMY